MVPTYLILDVKKPAEAKKNEPTPKTNHNG